MTREPSEERLNALVDGELAAADAEVLLEQLRSDAALRERLSQLRLSKELVRHAYAHWAPPRPVGRADDRRRWRPVAAGLVVLACGALLGWSVRERLASPAVSLEQLAQQTERSPRVEAERIILHLSSGSAQQALAVLERAEGLLETARASGRKVSVEVVANGGGLDLLRDGVSAHAGRIAKLRVVYPGLTLVACGQSVQRLRDSGVEVKLLPGTITATSALDEIVLRLQQGWAYVQI